MSPNEQKMTSGREAMAWARSIISSAVTQTGQPGPWTSSSSGGRIPSIPYLTMVCVWPPQTSMIVQGRVTVRAIAVGQLRAASPSRYSSRYFMMVASFSSSSWFICSRNSKTRARLGLVDARQGEADVDQHVFVRLRLGDVLEADALGDAAEVDLAHQDVVLAVGLDHSSGDCQAHRRLLGLSAKPLRRRAGPGSGRRRSAERADAGRPGTPRCEALPASPRAGALQEDAAAEHDRIKPGRFSKPVADLR